jgi:hypothetical protein
LLPLPGYLHEDLTFLPSEPWYLRIISLFYPPVPQKKKEKKNNNNKEQKYKNNITLGLINCLMFVINSEFGILYIY